MQLKRLLGAGGLDSSEGTNLVLDVDSLGALSETSICIRLRRATTILSIWL